MSIEQIDDELSARLTAADIIVSSGYKAGSDQERIKSIQLGMSLKSAAASLAAANEPKKASATRKLAGLWMKIGEK